MKKYPTQHFATELSYCQDKNRLLQNKTGREIVQQERDDGGINNCK